MVEKKRREALIVRINTFGGDVRRFTSVHAVVREGKKQGSPPHHGASQYIEGTDLSICRMREFKTGAASANFFRAGGTL